MIRNATYIDFAKSLEGEYRESFEQVRLYLENCCFDPDVLNDSLNDIVELLLSAQKDRIPASMVIGGDIAAFCNDILSCYRMTWRKSTRQILVGLALFVSLISVFGLVYMVSKAIVGERIGDLMLPIRPLLFYMIVGILAAALGSITRKFLWDHRRQRNKPLPKLSGLTFVFCVPLVIVGNMTHLLAEGDTTIRLWIGILVGLAFGATVLYTNYCLARKELIRRPAPIKINSNDEWWNYAVRTLRKNMSAYIQEHDSPLKTLEEQKLFLRRTITKKIALRLVVVAGMIVGSCFTVPVALRDQELSVIMLQFVKLTVAALLCRSAWKWWKCMKKLENDTRDIRDDSLLREVFPTDAAMEKIDRTAPEE